MGRRKTHDNGSGALKSILTAIMYEPWMPPDFSDVLSKVSDWRSKQVKKVHRIVDTIHGVGMEVDGTRVYGPIVGEIGNFLHFGNMYLEIDGRSFYGGIVVEITQFCFRWNIPLKHGFGFVYELINQAESVYGKRFSSRILTDLLKYYYFLGEMNENEKLNRTIAQFFSSAAPPIPERHYWRYFRLAKKGLGYLTAEEIEAVYRELGPATPSGRARKPESGLTMEEVAAFCQTNDRTVRKAVKECWAYCNAKNRDIYEIQSRIFFKTEIPLSKQYSILHEIRINLPEYY